VSVLDSFCRVTSNVHPAEWNFLWGFELTPTIAVRMLGCPQGRLIPGQHLSAMKILWICGLPYEVQDKVLGGENHGAYAAWSWIMGHLPPPPGVELHIACRTARHTAYRKFDYRGATFHLVPVKSRARVYTLFHFDWRYFREVSRTLAPDVIHGWGTEDCFSNAAIRLAPLTHLVQIQGCINACRERAGMHWVTRFSAISERRDLAVARQVVAENEYSLDCARPFLRNASLHVVEHPLRQVFLDAPPTRGDSRQIIFVGVTEERKGLWDALAAFEAVAPEDWKMTIIGTSWERNLAELKRRLAAPALAGRVVHQPKANADSIVSALQASSIFLLPTWVDTGPTTLKEAMSLGLWPVCFDNTGPGHYIRKFKFGTLARDKDRADLTSKLREVIETKPWKSPEHRAKIENFIRPHFRRERIWEDLQKLYGRIIAEAK
jgi:glycosyltransferase involved in cell wall biosynthesis